MAVNTGLQDERARRFSDLWFLQRNTATTEQKDKVGVAYITKILNLSSETATNFVKGNHDAYHYVGMEQSALRADVQDAREFWQEISRIFPGLHSEEDIQFLAEQGGVFAVLHFLWQIGEDSPVLHKLRVNAHVYK